ncbi:MAG: C25 family cysteine peptidase, partial [Bacteroidota bacterium]|nr:C25 family cysteine peptidase [Bacteroidota bacterium]
KATSSVIIPDMDEMTVEIVDAQYQEFTDIAIAPSKGNLFRDIDPATVPFEYAAEYSNDAFYPSEIASLRSPYILRDYRGQTVVVNPFRYNPVTKTLRVYYDITVKVTSTGNIGENTFSRSGSFTTVDNEFKNIYDNHFLNSGSDSRYTPVEEDGSILIIAHSDFMDAMQPYIDWKIMTGREVEMVDVADIGGSSDIESYIETYYNENDLTYCLLVGDAAQVPSSYSNGDSDNNYAYIEGGDHYPEIFMGRFSAENITDVETMVQRTLDYEKEPFTGEEWYTNSISVGSDQGPGDDDEYDYEHLRNIQDDLNGFGYTYNYEYFDGSQGGNDAAGSPSPNDVAEGINSGSTIINYTGHGSTTSWGSSGFSNSDVNNLTNADKLPFIWSVACVNGNFVGSTCFAEAWTRATNAEGNPTGAIATMMSTINQSWAPPMQGQDDMNDLLTEQDENNIKRTFGGLSFNGCMSMNDEYGGEGDDMTDTWTLFGDPSVMVRTDNPTDISASHNPTIFLGSSSFAVSASGIDGATVALTMDGVIYGVGTIEGGSATVNFENPLTVPGTMNLVITAFNKIPYITTVDVIPADGPYVTMISNSINDASGNGNGLADFGESILLNVELQNIGIEAAADVTVTLSSDDEFVTITDATEDAGTIAQDATVTLTDAFAFDIADNVPDQHAVIFTLVSTSGDDTWENIFSVVVNAPALSVGSLTIDDSANGNDNGRLDPGETVEVTIENINGGHADALSALANLTTISTYVTVQNTVFNIGTIAAEGTANAVFTVVCSAAAPVGTVINFDYSVTAGEYSADADFTVTAGLILENWENGLDNYDWQFSGNANWDIDNTVAYDGDNSLKSGDISDSQASTLTLEYESSSDDVISFYRKVSSEGSYDKLKFFIDDEEQAVWSGDLDWEQFEYPVTAGVHTFKWEYTKDGSQSTGEDCAWIDFIIFPPNLSFTATAGMDMAICEASPVTILGNATLYTSLQWTTDGDGAFDDATAMQPVYTPGQTDVTNGTVELTLTAAGSGDDIVDAMILTINDPATADAGEGMTLCEGETYTANAIAENYASVNWTTAGDGSFDDASILAPVYTPGTEDIANGTVTLTFTAMALEACSDAASDVIITINSAPAAATVAQGVVEVCAGTAADYSVETIENATSYVWTITPAEAGVIEDGAATVAAIAWNTDFAGVAQIVVAGVNDCGQGTESAPLEVTVNALPDVVEFVSGVDTVDHVYTESSSYTVNEVANASVVVWTLVPAEAGEITAEDYTAEVVWDDSFTGDAHVTVTASNDCGDVVSEYKVTVMNTVGFEDLDSVLNIEVYPNPNNGRFNLNLSGNDMNEVINVKILSPISAVVFQANNISVKSNYKETIDITDLADGIYYLVIENDKGRIIKKIIVQK